MCDVNQTASDIVQQFGVFKANYIQVMEENKALKETIELLSNRCQSRKNQRLKLIGFVKQSADKYRNRLQSLQEQNDQLKSVIEGKNQTVHEYSQKISLLESMSTKQKQEIENCLNTINSLKVEIASLKINLTNSAVGNSSTNASHNQPLIKINSTTCKLNHPLFGVNNSKRNLKKGRTSTIQSKKKKHQWSNLNVTFSGRERSNEIINSSASSSSEKNLSLPQEKRRKLFCQDNEETVDLADEKDL